MAAEVEDLVIRKLNKMEERYLENLKFLEEKVPALFEIINNNNDSPELLIDPNTLKVHRMKDGSNVYDGCPIEHAQQEVNKFNELFDKMIYPPPALGIELNNLIKKNPFTKTSKHYGKILERYGRSKLKPALKDIVIFGVGLGYHIEMLCNNTTYNNITIIENNAVNFKASMYCVNWKKILTNICRGSSITIHIDQNPEDKEQFKNELKRHCFRLYPTIGISTIIYNHSPDARNYNDAKDIVEEFSAYIKVSNELIGPEAQRLFNANENIKKKYKAIDLNKSKIYGNKIISIVGAGPSLDIYSSIIKENREKFYIVSSGSALSSLIKIGIKPDMHFELEFQILATTLLKYVNDDCNLKELDLICTFEASPGYPPLFKNSNMFIPESSELFSEFSNNNILNQGGITCANGAAALLSRITKEDIYLFGLDFAHTNGNHHSKTNISMNNDLPKDLEHVHTHMKKIRTNIKVEDTQGNSINTSAGLNAARLAFESLISSNIERKYFNCSYGAKIKNSNFISKDELINKLNVIDKNSKITFKKIANTINPETIHRRTDRLIETSLNIGYKILGIVSNFENNNINNCHNIIEIFQSISKNFSHDRGHIRNILSVSKAPLLQLFVVCNYTPKDEQEEIINIWTEEYRNYLKYLENLFVEMCSNRNYYIEKDWIG